MKFYLFLRSINWLGIAALLLAIGAFIANSMPLGLASIALAILSRED